MERERERDMMIMMLVVAGGGENDGRKRERESREKREGDKVDLSPNHGWCVSEEEPKGTKISPRVTCTCFELHIH